MAWGLDGVQLSYNTKSIVSSSGSFDGFKDYFMGDYVPYYDFYIDKHDYQIMPEPNNRRNRSGHIFVGEIIADANDLSKDQNVLNDIKILDLAQTPKSAVEYCYNRNKRDAYGNVIDMNWYLPAIDEIEDIVMSTYGDGLNTYSRFEEFQDKFYWSCQPSFYQGYMHYSIGQNLGLISLNPNDYANFFIDNPERARATKVSYTGFNQYDYAGSGVSGYYMILLMDGQMTNYNEHRHVWYLYDELSNSSSFTYQYIHKEGTWLTGDDIRSSREFTRDDLPQFEIGNKLRTDKARVRCVRRNATE